MEELIKVIVEQGLVAGSFIVMLYFFLTKFSKSQDLIASTLIEISKNMASMDTRLTRLEGRKANEDE